MRSNIALAILVAPTFGASLRGENAEAQAVEESRSSPLLKGASFYTSGNGYYYPSNSVYSSGSYYSRPRHWWNNLWPFRSDPTYSYSSSSYSDGYNGGLYNGGLNNGGLYNGGLYNGGLYNGGLYNGGYGSGSYGTGGYGNGYYNGGYGGSGLYSGGYGSYGGGSLGGGYGGGSYGSSQIVPSYSYPYSSYGSSSGSYGSGWDYNDIYNRSPFASTVASTIDSSVYTSPYFAADYAYTPTYASTFADGFTNDNFYNLFGFGDKAEIRTSDLTQLEALEAKLVKIADDAANAKDDEGKPKLSARDLAINQAKLQSIRKIMEIAGKAIEIQSQSKDKTYNPKALKAAISK